MVGTWNSYLETSRNAQFKCRVTGLELVLWWARPGSNRESSPFAFRTKMRGISSSHLSSLYTNQVDCLLENEMRVFFPPGMQKRFVEHTKLRSGLTWKQFRESLGIPTHVHYRYERCSLPKEVFLRALRLAKLTESEAHKYGFISVNERSEIVLTLNRNRHLAELIGISLGDGHLRQRMFAIFGNKSEDTVYLIHHVNPLMKRVLGLTPRLQVSRPSENCLVLYSTAASRGLHAAGLPYGNKIVNHARIPAWIFRRKAFLVACLRGLFDTDGSVYGFRRKPPARGSKAIISFEFGKGSLLAKNAFRALRQLGFSPRMMPNRNECRLAVNADIVRFMNEVRPVNGKHRSQFLRWHGPVV